MIISNFSLETQNLKKQFKEYMTKTTVQISQLYFFYRNLAISIQCLKEGLNFWGDYPLLVQILRNFGFLIIYLFLLLLYHYNVIK